MLRHSLITYNLKRTLLSQGNYQHFSSGRKKQKLVDKMINQDDGRDDDNKIINEIFDEKVAPWTRETSVLDNLSIAYSKFGVIESKKGLVIKRNKNLIKL